MYSHILCKYCKQVVGTGIDVEKIRQDKMRLDIECPCCGKWIPIFEYPSDGEICDTAQSIVETIKQWKKRIF